MDNNIVLVASAVGLISVTTLYIFVCRGMGSRASKVIAGSEKVNDEVIKSKHQDLKPKNHYPRGSLSIFFGSQTGTAEGFARIVMEEAKKQGFDARVIDLEDFSPEILSSTKLAFFLMATYGEGEPTDNAAAFYKWLKNEDGSVPTDYLANLNFCVFGLGNRQYEHFNRMGKFTDEHLEIFGAKRVMPLGLGDDDGSLEDDFEKWRETLWSSLLPSTTSISSRNSLIREEKEVSAAFKVVKHARSNRSTDHFHISSLSKPLFQSLPGTVVSIRELRLKKDIDEGSTYHVEFDLSQSKISYQTADNLAILPENDDLEVQRFAASQGYNLDDVYDILPLDGQESSFKRIVPSPFSVRELLTLYLDIKGLIRPAVAANLVYYTNDQSQKDWLRDLLSREKKDQYKTVIEDRRQSIYSLLLGSLSSCKLPLDALLQIVPVIQPRYYTISSSSSLYPLKPHITVSLTEESIVNDGKFMGQCSALLKRLYDRKTTDDLVNKNVRVFVKESAFRLPQSLSVPVIMIGPGTGFAPMRALLQERQYLRDIARSGNGGYGAVTLFFGCKARDRDHIYREEMENFVSYGIVTNYQVAYSREQQKKVYVQDLMVLEDNANAIWNDLQKGAYVFVCGATAMGSDVHRTLTLIASRQGTSKESGEKFVSRMKESGRYVQELWN